MSEEIKRKRGRPKTGGVLRKGDLHLRMTLDELDEIGRFSRIAGKSKADFIRGAVAAEIAKIEQERSERFACLNRGSEEDYGYFEEYKEDFEDDLN